MRAVSYLGRAFEATAREALERRRVDDVRVRVDVDVDVDDDEAT